jgi:hypothetical protein
MLIKSGMTNGAAETYDKLTDLLKVFDDKVADGTRALAGVADAGMMQSWRLTVKGPVAVRESQSVCVPGLHTESPDPSSWSAVGVPAPSQRTRARFVRPDGRRAGLTGGNASAVACRSAVRTASTAASFSESVFALSRSGAAFEVPKSGLRDRPPSPDAGPLCVGS